MVLFIVQLIRWRNKTMNEKKVDFAKEIKRLDEIVEAVSNKALSLDDSLKL